METQIAIVEDDDQVRRAIGRDLKWAGYKNVTLVNSGDEIIKMIVDNFFFELILMDMRMPGVDGFQTTEILLKINADIKIIALTAYYDYTRYLRFKEAGGKGYVLKPWVLEELVEIISLVSEGGTYFKQKEVKDYLPKDFF
jgi:two-component system response regulator DegU